MRKKYKKKLKLNLLQRRKYIEKTISKLQKKFTPLLKELMKILDL